MNEYVFSSKLKDINSEIDELRRQLEEKEMQAAEVKMELHRHDEAIENVRNSFSRQLSRLSKKEAAVKESRKEWEAEESAYKTSRSEHEAEVTAHSEALVAHDKLLSQIKSEVSIAEQLTVVVETDVISDGNKKGDDVVDEVAIAQAEVVKHEAAADEANEILMAAKAHIDSLVDEISSIDVRLPILEAEKKDAASKRDFKAAGKASKAIKEMVARKETCEEELNNEAIDRQANAQKEVDECLKALDEKKAISHEKEKEGGRQRMIELVKKIINLEQLREDVCVTNAVEGGTDGTDSVSVVGGFVLDSEIAALVSEGEDLDNKFGGWNDIMMEFADADVGNLTNETTQEKVQADLTEVHNSGEEGEITKTDHDCDEDIDYSEVITEEEIHQAQLAEEDEAFNEVDKTETQKESEDDSAKKEEMMRRRKEIVVEIEEIEAAIETAIEEEDYDTAAELDEKILSLKEEQKKLGGSESDADDSKESSQCTEKSYAMVSEKCDDIDSEIVDNETKDVSNEESAVE